MSCCSRTPLISESRTRMKRAFAMGYCHLRESGGARASDGALGLLDSPFGGMTAKRLRLVKSLPVRL